jgi:ABC-type transporter Mla subunit MlaD
MTNQYPGRQSDNRQSSGVATPGVQPRKQGQGSSSRSQVEGTPSTASSTAKRVASEAASTIGGQVKDLLDTQLANGADIIGQLGSSAQRAADDLEQDAPQLAGLVRGVAHRIEGYADDLREQSVDELVRSASNFTRRQPAVVFGLAALAGFFAFRTIKSTPLPTQPIRNPRVPSGDYYGG